MTVVAWALSIAALVTNVLAIRALFARDRFATWKRRCFTAAALLFCAVMLASAVSLFEMPHLHETTASAHAYRMGYAIATAMNGVAFAVLTTALPLIAGFVLRSREAKKPR